MTYSRVSSPKHLAQGELRGRAWKLHIPFCFRGRNMGRLGLNPSGMLSLCFATELFLETYQLVTCSRGRSASSTLKRSTWR